MTGEVKLLPCPFCGVGPVASDRTCYHPQNECTLDGWHFNIPNWQFRPTLVTGQLQEDVGDHALPPSGLSRSSASQAKPAAAIAKENKP